MRLSVIRLCAVGALALQLLSAPSPSPAQDAAPPGGSPDHEFIPSTGAMPRAALKETLTPEELANPATVTPRTDPMRVQDESPRGGEKSILAAGDPDDPRSRRADKLDPAPRPPPDPVTETLIYVFSILMLILLVAAAFAQRIWAFGQIKNSRAKWLLTPWLMFWSSLWRAWRNRRDARFSSLAPLLLPLLIAPVASPASYKYAKPEQAAPGGFSAYSKSAAPQAAAPEVTLALADPARPVLFFLNETGLAAKDVNYAIALWNAETLEELYPIDGRGPAALNPREAFGPIDLFDPKKAGAPKPGDKLVGNLSVNCRSCARGYSYWVYIEWGRGGWASEIAGIADGELVVPKGLQGVPPGITPQWSRTELLKRTLVAWVASVEPERRAAIARFRLPAGMRAVTPQ